MELTSKIYLFGFFVLLLFFLRFLFRKAEIHYKLLKNMFPENLKNSKTFYHFIFSLRCFYKLDISNLIWLTFPFYYSKDKNSLSEENKKYHSMLLKNNLIVLSIIALIILWLFGLGYLLFGIK